MNQIHMDLSKSLTILYQAPLNACIGLSQQLELFQEVAWKKKKNVLKTWRVKTKAFSLLTTSRWRFPHSIHCASTLLTHCGLRTVKRGIIDSEGAGFYRSLQCWSIFT